jgi:tetratricopeptide (TPR) repeat protein
MNLGSVLIERLDLDGAQERYEKALSIYEEVFGHDSTHPGMAMTITGLGNVLRLKGDLNGAQKRYEEALSIFENVYGHDSPHHNVAMTLGNLGNVLVSRHA